MSTKQLDHYVVKVGDMWVEEFLHGDSLAIPIGTVTLTSSQVYAEKFWWRDLAEILARTLDGKVKVVEILKADEGADEGTIRPIDIYLAGPYSDPNYDVCCVRFCQLTKFAGELIKAGYIILSPISHSHLIANYSFLPNDADFWQRHNKAWLLVCKELWVLKLDGWEESKGVQWEIEQAKQLDIPVVYKTFSSAIEKGKTGLSVREYGGEDEGMGEKIRGK